MAIKSLTELTTNEDYSMYKTVIENLRNCSIICTIQQAFPGNDDYLYLDINKKVIEAQTSFMVNGKYFYLTLENISTAASIEFKNMFQSIMQRGTSRFKEHLENDYILLLSLVQTNENSSIIYSLDAIQPIFCMQRQTDLIMIFETSAVSVGLTETSLDEINYNILDSEEQESLTESENLVIDDDYSLVDNDELDNSIIDDNEFLDIDLGNQGFDENGENIEYEDEYEDEDEDDE